MKRLFGDSSGTGCGTRDPARGGRGRERAELRAQGLRAKRTDRDTHPTVSSTPVGKTFWHNLKGSSLDTFFKRVHVEPRRQEGSRREAATPGGLPCAARKKASS